MTASLQTTLQQRRFIANYSDETPRYWCANNAALTQVLNSYTLLVPGNEGFFIRTLKLASERIADPELRETIKHFSYQEGQHGAGHLRFWQILERQGYRIRPRQRRVDYFLYRIVERITPLKLKLSMVSCIEHINAFVGHEFLAQNILEDAEPTARALFEWHFAEEIEHKNVGFDVLNAVAPSYSLRLIGTLLVAPLFYLLITLGALHLLRQDKLLRKRKTWRQLREHLWGKHHMVRRTFAHLFDYLRPGFHPSQLKDAHLASAIFERRNVVDAIKLQPMSQVA